jgi:CarD family transcriptional regulator
MFSKNEKVVYPGHGVAQINRIIEKNIAGTISQFLELKFLSKDMIILVPANNAVAVGVRRLSSFDHVNKIFKMLAEPTGNTVYNSLATTNWNKRNKEYQGKIRSGDLCEICEIYRDLKQIALQKELSFGEKLLLAQTETLLVEEIALVKDISQEVIMAQLKTLTSAMCIPSKQIEKNI